jgi:toxin ParE1/3/4
MTLVKRSAFFRDLDKYANHITKDDPDAGRRLIDAAEQACAALALHPEMGHEEAFRKRAGIRSWRVKGFENYLIFYQITSDTVDILRLIHGARDLPTFFRR